MHFKTYVGTKRKTDTIKDNVRSRVRLPYVRVSVAEIAELCASQLLMVAKRRVFYKSLFRFTIKSDTPMIFTKKKI